MARKGDGLVSRESDARTDVLAQTIQLFGTPSEPVENQNRTCQVK